MTTTADHAPSRTCYQRGCRLPECVKINYRYEKGLKYDIAHGRRRQVDAQQARAHVERLRALGWVPAQIAAVSGVSRSLIYAIDQRNEIRSHVALALLSVRIAPAPAKAAVDATGTIRRIRALAAMGHTLISICTEAGYGHNRVEQLAAGVTTTVTAETAATVAAIYKRLAHKPGPSKQTRAFARKNGWHGPLAWDDIDDPNCEPEKSERYVAVVKYERDPYKKAEIEHLYLLGESPEQIAKRFDGNEKYIRDRVNEIIAERAQRAQQEKTAKAGLEAAA